MKELVRLVAAIGLGTLVATGVVALAAPAPQTCSGSADLARINKRFDDLDQAIANLQAQLAKAASDDALANANNERQLAAISSQVAVVSTTVAAISGRIR
jgi:phage I-like protein